jgi:type IV secretory pathway TrbL component
MIPVRALFVAFLMTLVSFALSLLLSLIVMVVAKLHGATPDLRFAYRHIALPVALSVGAIVLVLALVMEIRHYRQIKALAAIERASR